MISSINSQSIPNLGKHQRREQVLHNNNQERLTLVEKAPLAKHRSGNFYPPIKDTKKTEMLSSQKRNYNNWSMSSFDKISWTSQRKNWKSYINPQVNKYYVQIVKRMKSQDGGKSNKNDDFERQDRVKNLSFMYQPQIQSKIEKTSVGTSAKAMEEAQTQTQAQNKEVEVKGYEARIDVLEHQNTNLKDQLFYLRQAILARYELFNQNREKK